MYDIDLPKSAAWGALGSRNREIREPLSESDSRVVPGFDQNPRGPKGSRAPRTAKHESERGAPRPLALMPGFYRPGTSLGIVAAPEPRPLGDYARERRAVRLRAIRIMLRLVGGMRHAW